ncbi:apolipoprotein acyltransferase [Jannaschia sp.]|nr:apolipoprotein acyltransferase [Jannaschia sp.]
MLPLFTAIAGAIAGALFAVRKRGNGFDIAQYAAVWAVIGGLLGLLAIIVLTRL